MRQSCPMCHSNQRPTSETDPPFCEEHEAMRAKAKLAGELRAQATTEDEARQVTVDLLKEESDDG